MAYNTIHPIDPAGMIMRGLMKPSKSKPEAAPAMTGQQTLQFMKTFFPGKQKDASGK